MSFTVHGALGSVTWHGPGRWSASDPHLARVVDVERRMPPDSLEWGGPTGTHWPRATALEDPTGVPALLLILSVFPPEPEPRVTGDVPELPDITVPDGAVPAPPRAGQPVR